MENTVIEKERNPWPVTVDDLKRHLRITNCDFDGDLDFCLSAAMSRAEVFTGQMIVEGKWEISGKFTRHFDTDILPINSVLSISVDGKEIPPVMVEKAEINGHFVEIPEEVEEGKKLTVTIDGGMGNIPYDIRAAVLMMAGSLYEHPADSVENLPKASTNLLKSYRRWR